MDLEKNLNPLPSPTDETFGEHLEVKLQRLIKKSKQMVRNVKKLRQVSFQPIAYLIKIVLLF